MVKNEMTVSGSERLMELHGKIREIQKHTEEYIEKEQKEAPMEKNIQKDIILFFSFDVVNSTAYKTIDYYGWAGVLNELFKELRTAVKNKINSSQMWRVLGDEVVFITKIKSEDDLRDIVNKIFVILISTIHRIKTGEFFASITSDINKQKLMQLQNILSLKAAAWIAPVSNVGNNKVPLEDPELENIFEKYQSHEGYEIFEFLGNDIDTGFRISKQTLDGKFVISYELAYLISQKTESVPYLHIVTYKQLKGVWKNKLYPIIWYHNPKAFQEIVKKEITLEESFPFDAREEHELIREYFDNIDPESKNRVIRELRMFTDTPYALNKILDDRGLRSKINRLQEMIKNASDQKMDYLESLGLQLHCAAVCFKVTEEGPEILVAKRSGNKELRPNCWEFGCAHITANQSIVDRVKEDYKDDFGLEIEPVLNKERQDQQPIPLALYQVESKNHSPMEPLTNKGVIILAEIKRDEELNLKKDKYEEILWVKEDNYEELFKGEEKNCVSDFMITLKDAFARIKKLDL